MVVDTLGRTFGGRPRRTGALANLSGPPSVERSGAVSGSKPRSMGLSFLVIGFSHADDSARVVARHPGKYRHRIVQKAHGDKANFTMNLPVVLDGQHRVLRDSCRPCHVQSPNLDRLRAFFLVELDPHGLMLLQKLAEQEQPPCPDKPRRRTSWCFAKMWMDSITSAQPSRTMKHPRRSKPTRSSRCLCTTGSWNIPRVPLTPSPCTGSPFPC